MTQGVETRRNRPVEGKGRARRPRRTGLAVATGIAVALLAGTAGTPAGAIDTTGTTDTGRERAPDITAPDSPAEAAGARLAAERAGRVGIEWGPCDPSTRLPDPIECGTVSVPVDYADPSGDSFDLHVSRLTASGPPEERRGALLYNPGGPGGNGMSFPLFPLRLATPVWRELNTAYDMVGWAPRGVGPSAPVSCTDPELFGRGPGIAPRPPSAEFKREMDRRAAEYAAGCPANRGEWAGAHTTPNNARDLYVLRAALGQERLDYLGTSYGTYIGSVYATFFPESVGRMVLDSVVDPDPVAIWYDSNLLQSLAFESRWSDWKEWVARHHDVHGLGETAQDVQRAVDALMDAVDAEPLEGVVGSKEVHEAYLSVAYSDAAWPGAAAALVAFAAGDPEPVLSASRPGTDPAGMARRENSNAVYTTVECSDAPWPRSWERWDADHSLMAREAPFETWENAWLNLPCRHWTGPQVRPVDVQAEPGTLPPILLVQAERDAATPARGASEVARRLPGSVTVLERGAGNHGVIGGNACVDALIRAYLVDGAVPAGDRTCAGRAEPEPWPPATGEGGTDPVEEDGTTPGPERRTPGFDGTPLAGAGALLAEALPPARGALPGGVPGFVPLPG
ncbi:alpha/beta hydrolase [Streptomyces calidiresistens]|uniref:Alpha/beta fold hydrolase n=1 Tax=Streptomyces calidiresistens TaxID=1485586 RepID=A0A7W3T3D8_9ACTN|nr:alpha/beta hydrolase [Streptomyces calidiresistens]MBB0230220.1 alpha/beta fold hydrolase [Streptomyces calidiresistens]